MVGYHFRQTKTQICTVGDVGFHRQWISFITNILNYWAPVPLSQINVAILENLEQTSGEYPIYRQIWDGRQKVKSPIVWDFPDIWKPGFRSSLHINPSRKRSFLNRRSSNRRNQKNASFSFSRGRKHFENGAFWKRWHHHNDLIPLTEFSLFKRISKMTAVIIAFLNFCQTHWNPKWPRLLSRFQSGNSVFKFNYVCSLDRTLYTDNQCTIPRKINPPSPREGIMTVLGREAGNWPQLLRVRFLLIMSWSG